MTSGWTKAVFRFAGIAETWNASPARGRHSRLARRANGDLEPPRRFVEPVGFLTNYRDRAGGEPGSSRLRPRSVDEARLLTKAPSSLIGATDVRDVSTFFASAIGSADHPEGQMIVVNRGPNGTGYMRCPRCEHAEPALNSYFGFAPVGTKHLDPRTGDPCPVEELKGATYLAAHLFDRYQAHTDSRAD